MSHNITSGARVLFSLDGNPVALAAGVTITEDFMQDPAFVLNQLNPSEYVTTAYTVQMTARQFRVPRKSLVNLNLWPQMGRNPQEHLRLVLDFPELTGAVWDTYANVQLGKILQIKPRTKRVDFTARGIIAEDATFVAMFYADEGSADI